MCLLVPSVRMGYLFEIRGESELKIDILHRELLLFDLLFSYLICSCSLHCEDKEDIGYLRGGGGREGGGGRRNTGRNLWGGSANVLCYSITSIYIPPIQNKKGENEQTMHARGGAEAKN